MLEKLFFVSLEIDRYTKCSLTQTGAKSWEKNYAKEVDEQTIVWIEYQLAKKGCALTEIS